MYVGTSVTAAVLRVVSYLTAEIEELDSSFYGAVPLLLKRRLQETNHMENGRAAPLIVYLHAKEVEEVRTDDRHAAYRHAVFLSLVDVQRPS